MAFFLTNLERIQAVRPMLTQISKNRRALAKALSEVENSEESTPKWYETIYKNCGKAKIIGITGAPGAGKSSLINLLIKEFLNKSLRVAVLAIDPSSPYSGGAILGDRTRMILSAEDNNVFIRSSASRGRLGGLSPKTLEMVHVLDAANYDVIIIETVGVGQAEMDIMKCAHLVALVLSPHTGDGMQALKAGILEIADIFILNKADLLGMNELEKDLLSSLMLAPEIKQIAKTSTYNNQGISELCDKLLKIHEELSTSGEIKTRIERSLIFEFTFKLRESLLLALEKDEKFTEKIALLEKKIIDRSKSPQKCVTEILSYLEKTKH